MKTQAFLNQKTVFDSQDFDDFCLRERPIKPTGRRSILKYYIHTGRIKQVTDRRIWAQSLVEDCRSGLSTVLPLQRNEIEFLDLILDRGIVRPDLLTLDHGMQVRISTHPGIQWKALNVRNYKTN